MLRETKLNVMLIGKTEMSRKFFDKLKAENPDILTAISRDSLDSQAIALTAIRTCYSANKPTEIVAKEGEKYFGQDATDGKGGKEADRLIRHIIRSKHTSTLEHISYTFAIEGLSRAALAQLTRHRHFSFSVQSQRYVKFGSGDKAGGFDYVVPPSVRDELTGDSSRFDLVMDAIQKVYDDLRKNGVPAEDARFVLPNAAATNLVLTGNLRAILEFYSKRKPGRGAQWEIADLAEQIRSEIVEVDPWAVELFSLI